MEIEAFKGIVGYTKQLRVSCFRNHASFQKLGYTMHSVSFWSTKKKRLMRVIGCRNH